MNQPLHRFKAELYKALGHPLRIRILELLRPGEVSVADLLQQLEVEPSTASQHLAVLRSRGIVDSRREASTVYYKVRDPLMFELLDAGRRIFNKHVVELQGLLAAQEREDRLLERRGHGARRRSRVAVT